MLSDTIATFNIEGATVCTINSPSLIGGCLSVVADYRMCVIFGVFITFSYPYLTTYHLQAIACQFVALRVAF